tara:strand:+ start:6214 stop:8322 length:2109 start_codon:yes stop_codon:yes gene_type:complete
MTDDKVKHADEAASDHREDESLTRRDFIKKGAVVGAGAAAIGGTIAAASVAKADASIDDIVWDYEVDVVVVGAGCAGLPAAIRARDLGATVLLVDQNFDVGGKMLHSGSWTSLGGGDAVQKRDLAGASDAEGMVTVEPLVEPAALEDNPELLFKDMTDWSIVDTGGVPRYRYNERDLHRAWANNTVGTRQFLLDNYVRYARINGTHYGGGVSRARAASAVLRLGDKTDMRAGTVTPEDAGKKGEFSSQFAPRVMSDSTKRAGEGIVHNGAAMARPLEFSAREKGVHFMLNRHLDELIREEQFSGQILGISASYTPRFDPNTGERLESLWGEGNIDERRESINIRARKAVVLASGGYAGNPQMRSMFYPAMREPTFVTSAWALLGPDRAEDGSAMKAGLAVGANLSGMQQNYNHSVTYHIKTRIATRDAYTDMYPGHPTFPFRGSAGVDIGTKGFEHVIAVNQVGKRFFNEIDLPKRPRHPRWPGGAKEGVPRDWSEHVPTDWRNSRPEWIAELAQGAYTRHDGVDAALAINEGSSEPDFLSGPLWVIFDDAAVERGGWNINYPFTSPDNGQFFSASSIEALAQEIMKNPYSRVPMSHLADTVAAWNGFVDKAYDDDFERQGEKMHKIEGPTFYAASLMIIWHDTYGGLRINGKTQVVDMDGKVIPRLYAGGEASGGGGQHGLGRGVVHGYIAGKEAAMESSS